MGGMWPCPSPRRRRPPVEYHAAQEPLAIARPQKGTVPPVNDRHAILAVDTSTDMLACAADGNTTQGGREAVLSSEGDMTSFTVGGRTIRFKTPASLVRYEKVTKWDHGYIECLAMYDDSCAAEEEYIDLIPILKNLYFDPEKFLQGVEEVRVQYA